MFNLFRKIFNGTNEKIKFNERIVVVIKNTESGKIKRIDTGSKLYKIKRFLRIA